jgi:hypothetical protein
MPFVAASVGDFLGELMMPHPLHPSSGLTRWDLCRWLVKGTKSELPCYSTFHSNQLRMCLH